MLRVLFMGIIVIHGLIHLMGFVKGYNLAPIDGLTKEVSRGVGLLWLWAAILLAGTVLVFFLNWGWWWMPAALAVVLSQVLVTMYWQDAKFGTIANGILLVGVMVGFSLWSFNLEANHQAQELLGESPMERKVVTQEMLEGLPLPVQRWLNYSGVIGKEEVQTVYLKQQGLLRLKPEEKNWLPADAQQYFTIDKPSFIWTIRTQMMGLPVVGRDLFKDGQGGMEIRLVGIIPVVKVGNDPKLNQSTLQRFLGEIAWFPAAALSPYIQWEPIDENSAKATMDYGGVSGSAIFYFDEMGALTKLVADRYKDITDQEPQEWVATVLETGELSGIKVPTKLEVSWILDTGEFIWYKFEVTDLRFNEEVK